ncbi:ATP-dependent 6-phosphofructokinase [Trifolium repens]|nr:ATP-dependent 6-phosphofructokinase [Trifolium repens]
MICVSIFFKELCQGRMSSFVQRMTNGLLKKPTILELEQKAKTQHEDRMKRCGLKVTVVGIPETIDNDIPVIDKSIGFNTVVEEEQRAINSAHVEAESAENGIGAVKLMGRCSDNREHTQQRRQPPT